MLHLEDDAVGSPVEQTGSAGGPSVSIDDDSLMGICLAACAEWEIPEAWADFISELVNGTNGAYGSAGMFDPNVASEYAQALAEAIEYRLVTEGEDETIIRALDFTTLYNTLTTESED